MLLVTSLGKEGFHQYGQRMLSSLKENCKLPVRVYSEDRITLSHGELHDLQGVEGWKEFQVRSHNFRPQSYLYDAVRFSHKVYAQLDAFESRHKYVVWLDADTVVKKPLSERHIKNQLNGAMCAFLGRQNSYTETGILIFDTSHEDFEEFKKAYRSYYDDGFIYLLPAYTDCHAFDAARMGKHCFNLTPEGAGVQDVFSISPFADHIDHDKGNLKNTREAA